VALPRLFVQFGLVLTALCRRPWALYDFEELRPDVEHRAELDFWITTLSGTAANYTFDAQTRFLDASDVLEVLIFCDASLYKEVLNLLDFPAVSSIHPIIYFAMLAEPQ
jgi:hypothetical protein